MTKGQYLEFLQFRLSKIDERRVQMFKNIKELDEKERKLIEQAFNLKFQGIEFDIQNQIMWINKNL